MSNTIIGIDLSINSTGICVKNSDDVHYYIITSKQTKKLQNFRNKYIDILFYKKINNQSTNIEKESSKSYNIYSITQIIKKIIKKYSPQLCVIEGVSYSSNGSVVDLAGLNYMVRYILLEMNIPFYIVTPMQNKKTATGNGNADKDLMIDAWKRLDDNIRDIKDIKIDDLADAYFLACYPESI